MENNQNMTTTTQQEGTQQTAGTAQQADQGQQSEKLFTQADVDRIVGNRLARMKQDLETSDTYRRERDEARRELEEYKNNAFLKEKGVRADDVDYVSFKASQLIDDKTDFKQAVEKFLTDNPRFTGRGFRVVSTGAATGNINGSGRSGGSGAEDAAIRKAMGLKG